MVISVQKHWKWHSFARSPEKTLYRKGGKPTHAWQCTIHHPERQKSGSGILALSDRQAQQLGQVLQERPVAAQLRWQGRPTHLRLPAPALARRLCGGRRSSGCTPEQQSPSTVQVQAHGRQKTKKGGIHTKSQPAPDGEHGISGAVLRRFGSRDAGEGAGEQGQCQGRHGGHVSDVVLCCPGELVVNQIGRAEHLLAGRH
mmetsp:Transcript_20303/g.56673  ORF Transcript_20303/g.56673 Transcript_20303/m.56673 type:complete len:200 (-) Transcript_20303:820-1419(-)